MDRLPRDLGRVVDLDLGADPRRRPPRRRRPPPPGLRLSGILEMYGAYGSSHPVTPHAWYPLLDRTRGKEVQVQEQAPERRRRRIINPNPNPNPNPEDQDLEDWIHIYAHVRGGGELGPAWHAAGRREHKPNSVRDAVYVLDHLVRRTSILRAAVVTSTSAGGIVAAGVASARPEYVAGWRGLNPFLDVSGTMTTRNSILERLEVEEWGDPRSREGMKAILQACPYHGLGCGCGCGCGCGNPHPRSGSDSPHRDNDDEKDVVVDGGGGGGGIGGHGIDRGGWRPPTWLSAGGEDDRVEVTGVLRFVARARAERSRYRRRMGSGSGKDDDDDLDLHGEHVHPVWLDYQRERGHFGAEEGEIWVDEKSRDVAFAVWSMQQWDAWNASRRNG